MMTQRQRLLPAASVVSLMLAALPAVAQSRPANAAENDQTLRAMSDEMSRSMARLVISGQPKPYWVSYRLIDLDVRSVTANFGALQSSETLRNRLMTVDVRVGDYHLDSSNFVTDEGFRGFLGSSGQVGIDRDYTSLRQDLWLATDQAYKEAVEQLGRKQAFLRSLAKPPEIDDFSREQPVVAVEPRVEPDWSARNWEQEAKAASAVFRSFPQFTSGRLSYYMVYSTYYLMNSEGTQVRLSSCVAAVEASAEAEADDGTPLHDFYAAYARSPAELPSVDAMRQQLQRVSSELMAMRAAPTVPDYAGPVLFEPRASGALLAQLLGPSVSGARPPLAMVPLFDQMMDRVGGRSEWSGRMGSRVLPTSISVYDDPGAGAAQGQPLLGHYEVDAEGVRGQRVALVDGGFLHNLLMSRRPGPEFDHSNGHGRSAFLSDPHPMISSLFFQSTEALSPAELRKKFLDACRADGHPWCLEVKSMDNPALASHRQEDFSDAIASLVAGAQSGDRLPLLVYRVYVSDGHEEPVRGARLTGVDLRLLRSIAGVGDDSAVSTVMQNPAFAGTALASFSSAQGGVPSSIVAPSLLLEEVDVRGPHGEPRRLPLLPPPPLN